MSDDLHKNNTDLHKNNTDLVKALAHALRFMNHTNECGTRYGTEPPCDCGLYYAKAKVKKILNKEIGKL